MDAKNLKQRSLKRLAILSILEIESVMPGEFS
jgi:hypothetical protein